METGSLVSEPPREKGLNIAGLSAMFRHTTNSYKYLFFLAILNLVKRLNFDPTQSLSYDSITVEMLSIAWYPHSYFHLSFGTQDTIGRKLDELAHNSPLDINACVNNPKLLRQKLSASDLRSARRLMDFVPYRLLMPFLAAQFQDIDKASWMLFEKQAPAIINRSFLSAKPLYRFDSDIYEKCSEITVHPDWLNYLARHHSILEAWTAWHFVSYMQRRNPSAPALINKIFPPARRSPLTTQSRYWDEAIYTANAKGEDIKCIYSHRAIKPGDYVLDHYLPWSFVTHDQLWNLLPTFPDVNSSKSNKLPDELYFDDLVRLHHAALIYAEQSMTRSAFRKATEDYWVDLGLTPEHLLEFGALHGAYERNLKPLLSLANNQGFTSDWRFTADQ